jgi:hypothetical protein
MIYDELLSSLAFEFNLCRYSAVMLARTAASTDPTTKINNQKTSDAAVWRGEAVKRW